MAKMKELFTARGRLLIKVLDKPGITIKELAERLFLTRRSIWGCVGELRSADYLIAVKKGRMHRYYITDRALDELRKLTEGKGKW